MNLSDNCRKDLAYSRGEFLETDCFSCFFTVGVVEIDPLPYDVDFALAEVSEARQWLWVLGGSWEESSEDAGNNDGEESFDLQVPLEWYTRQLLSSKLTINNHCQPPRWATPLICRLIICQIWSEEKKEICLHSISDQSWRGLSEHIANEEPGEACTRFFFLVP
jgi:hypothetical protein